MWLDEAPPAAYTASSIVTKVVKPKVVIDAARRIAGVEVKLPSLPTSYALLGAELVDADVDGLEVIVLVNEVGVPFPSPSGRKASTSKSACPTSIGMQ